MASTGWYGYDLDGTLAIYSVWNGPEIIGRPIPLAIEHLKGLLAQGKNVKIFTARVCSLQTPEDIEIAIRTIEGWCLEHIGVVLPITAEKDYNLIEYYDDRAIQVEFNTGKLLTFEEGRRA